VNPIGAEIVTAKGDLIVGTGNGAVDNLAVGANETRLVAASGEVTGLKYVADTTNYAVGAKGDLLVGTAADTVVAVSVGANGKVLTADSSVSPGVAWSDVPFPRSYLAGFALANNAGDATNDIDFSTGSARNSTDAANLKAATAMTKQLDAAWAAGTNAGGRMSAAAIANTTYHLYVIKKDSDGTCDFGFDTSATAPTMPSGYTYFRRIGSILRESGAIVAFKQAGDKFFRNAVKQDDVNATNPGTAAVTGTMSVPTGIVLDALVHVYLDPAVATAMSIRLSSLDVSDEAAGGPLETDRTAISATAIVSSGPWPIRTNISAQIRYRINVSGGGQVVRLSSAGWVDRRGRDD
jgi:hypothetical protein